MTLPRATQHAAFKARARRRSLLCQIHQLLAFLLELDFGDNDTLEKAAVNVDMPRFPGVLDEERCFSSVSIVLTHGREHPLGVEDRDLIRHSGKSFILNSSKQPPRIPLKDILPFGIRKWNSFEKCVQVRAKWRI